LAWLEEPPDVGVQNAGIIPLSRLKLFIHFHFNK
jgi:hypothetical protein